MENVSPSAQIRSSLIFFLCMLISGDGKEALSSALLGIVILKAVTQLV